MNSFSSDADEEIFEARFTGIYESPAKLLAEASSRTFEVASIYGRELSKKERRPSDAQLRRLDELEQCALFFWMCYEVVDKCPGHAVRLLDKKSLPQWNDRSAKGQSLFYTHQCLSYTSVLGSCLLTLTELAADRFFPSLFAPEDWQCLLKVALRFPQPEINFLCTPNKVERMSDHIPCEIQKLISAHL